MALYDPLAQFGYQSLGTMMPGAQGGQAYAPLSGAVFQQNPLPGTTTNMLPGGGMMGGTNSTLSAAAPGADWFSKEGMFGANGWAGPAAGIASGLLQGFMGMQNYGLAKDQLALQREAYETNTLNQKKMVNGQLEDRQRARVASNSGAYQSVNDYMDKNRI